MNYFNYYTEIEETFIRRRGKHLFLSPIDWALIEVWQDRGIPLHIVIRSVESVFDVYDKQPPGTRTIKSLFYCREEIEAQYKEWQASQTGKADGSSRGRGRGSGSDSGSSSSSGSSSGTEQFSPDAVAAHIASAIAALKANSSIDLKEDISRAVARLEELSANTGDDFETIDATLSDIEKLLDRAMLTNWENEHLKSLQKEVALQLRAYKSEMEPDAYKNTFELMLLKRLREEAGIPRLGLFYL